jgi:hypothetical protein
MADTVDRMPGLGVPQNDLVVVAGGGDELTSMGGDAADRAYVSHRKVLFLEDEIKA